VRIDPHRPERRVVCPYCRMPIDFVVSVDPKSLKPRVSIVVSTQAVRIEGDSLGKKTQPAKAVDPPPSAPKTIRGLIAECTACGSAFPVDAAKLPLLQACPQCRASYYVTARTDPATKKKVAVLLPQSPAAQPTRASSKPRTGKTRFGMSAVAQLKAETVIPSRKGKTRTVVPVKPPPKPGAPEPPPGAQVVQCTCGEYHIVRRKDLGPEIPCGGCGRILQFEETRDPQTLAPKIRIKPE
jgi:uncharacterized protein YbaR (Trm112 family)